MHTKESPMILRTSLKNPATLMRVGMALLALGLVSLRFLHPATPGVANVVDGLAGLVYGVAIACLLLSIRLRRGGRGARRP
jgi:hypothetical protein